MKVTEIAFTCYPVKDVKAARNFYEQVLGLKAERTFGEGNMGWIEYDIGPGTLALGYGVEGWNPNAGGGSVGLEVADFPAAMEKIKAAGVKVATGPFETPVCHMVVVSDPDGNSITIHKRKS